MLSWVQDHWKRVLTIIAAVLIGYWVLGSCFPNLNPRHLPTEVTDKIQKVYVHCITDLPIFPGEHRQPECGQVNIRVTGLGTITETQKAEGITKAICYKVTYTNPSMTTQGSAIGHDILWFDRTSSKVTVLQNGSWQLFPDQDVEDQQRWQDYACPEAFEVK